MWKNTLFFDRKGKTFFEKDILDLSERWEDIIEQNGRYIID